MRIGAGISRWRDDFGPRTEADFSDQMTHYSNEIGVTALVVSNTYKFGPYLSRLPENPINGLSTIKMVANGERRPRWMARRGGFTKPRHRNLSPT